MRIEHAIEIDAPVARVWELTLEVESWPTLTPTMTSVERLDRGPLRVGSRARIEQPGQGAKTWTVSQLDDAKTFAWRTRAFGMTMTATHRLEGHATSTTNRLVVEMDGLLAPILGPLLRRPVLAAITTENQGFKRAAEAN